MYDNNYLFTDGLFTILSIAHTTAYSVDIIIQTYIRN
jgi:hypothetical protein